jgi:phosphoglycerate dehydrogenase-like enzyme
VFGHEQPIAEYVVMMMLVLTHCLFEAATFRSGSWSASPHFGGGFSHGEVLGRTIGIVG